MLSGKLRLFLLVIEACESTAIIHTDWMAAVYAFALVVSLYCIALKL